VTGGGVPELPLRPQALRPGDRVAIVAPGSPVDERRLAAGVALLRSWGLQPVVFPHVLDRIGFLAGSDEDRLSDLAGAFADPGVRGIICARGGYGSQRIVDGLDYAAVGRDPKVFVGSSDVTALHLALGRRAGLVTFHGPMAASATLVAGHAQRTAPPPGEDGAYNSARSAAWLRRAVMDPAPLGPLGPPPRCPCGGAGAPVETLVPGIAVGPLVGGNLSLLCASIGTQDAPLTAGCLLLLEEVGEAPYRVDRMLRHLLRAGVLEQLAGVVVGECVGCVPTDAGPSVSVREVVADVLGSLGRPAVMGLPLGHGPVQLTVPLGVPARLDAGGRKLDFLEPALAPPVAQVMER
jgi:muramoyltetrapeptide carboxypeptidase